MANFDLTVASGEILAIVGTSGTGKTTLLNIAALVEDVQAGEIRLDGRGRTGRDAGSVPIGYVFQTDALLPWRTVWENVLLAVQCDHRRYKNRPSRTSALMARAATLFGILGLSGTERAYPASLSVGQRQRVSIVVNLVIDPGILLLDEPSASLDFQSKLILEEELLRVIGSVTADGALRTTVLVTHDIEQAIVLADRIVVVGRSLGESAHVVLEVPVDIPRSDRNPATTRRLANARNVFDQVWATIRPFAIQQQRVNEPQSMS